MPHRTFTHAALLPLAPLVLALSLGGCSPTVRIEAPDKPIVINMNVKIEHEVRVRVEREVDSLAKTNPGIF
jgi:hypothetical protein